MKHISWIVTLPIAILAVVFVLSNRQTVEIDIWPLELSLSGPLYLILVLSLLVGFLIGAAAMWISAGASRKRARQAERRLRELEAEAARLARQAEQDKAPAGTAPASQAPAAVGGAPMVRQANRRPA